MSTEREADLGFARLDLERVNRCGTPEAVYAPGKTPAQLIAILNRLRESHPHVMATRVTPEVAEKVVHSVPRAVFHEAGRCILVDREPLGEGIGKVTVLTAGTSDLPVAEEARLTAERMGAAVKLVADVGVAGLHRLLTRLPDLQDSRVVVVVAGMEGALPSVVGGLVACPVIAVPTSVGYGANFQGLSALLGMLTSCVPGVVTVNIDDGFGAGVAAALINRRG